MASKKMAQSTALIMAGGALVVGVVAGRMTAPKQAGGEASPEAVAPAEGGAGRGAAAGPYKELPLVTEPSPSKGPEDAPVVIYEFSDFQCPFCSRVTGTVDQIVQTWPNDVRLVFRHHPLPFHNNAHLAAIAAAAAARQGHFWAYHDTLFANQKALSRDDLIAHAKGLGLDMKRFEKDLDDPALARKVDADADTSVAVGATGTPAFFINGVKLSGAKPFDEFKAEIDKQLAQAKTLEGQGVARKDIARKLTMGSGDSAAAFVKYVIEGVPAPKQKKQEAKQREKPEEDTKTVWKLPVDPAVDNVKGPKYAQVTIAEFSDFQCPFCSKALPTIKKIRETYPDKVRVVFKDNPLPFHADAPLASEAAHEAAAQGKFWEMHDKLFANQKALKRENLETYAQELGLDMAKFKAALDDGRHKARIAVTMQQAQDVQGTSTPLFYVNGRQLKGAKPFEEFKKIIDEEIAKTDKMLEQGVKIEDLYDKLIAGGKVYSPLEGSVFAIDIAGSPFKGKANAPITIVEFSDFQCPYCSRVVPPLKQLEAKYPEQVKVVFKNFPLSFHKNAQKAAEAAMAAHAQGRFWDMHDIMFQNQKALTVDKLRIYAEQLGLDTAKFNSELDSGKYAPEVARDFKEGQKVKVKGTPTLYVNGQKFRPAGGYSVENMEKAFARYFGLKLKD